MFLARKISRSKWNAQIDLGKDEISADAITGDLRTQGNRLSLWRCRTNKESDVNEAVLAIAAAGDRVDSFDIVLVENEELISDGQDLDDSLGRTPIPDLVDRHVDVCDLDYMSLGKFAYKILTAIKNNQCRRIRRSQLINLLKTAAEKNRFDESKLKDGIKKVIKN